MFELAAYAGKGRLLLAPAALVKSTRSRSLRQVRKRLIHKIHQRAGESRVILPTNRQISRFLFYFSLRVISK